MQVDAIQNEPDYRKAMEEIDQLMNARPNTPEGDRLDALIEVGLNVNGPDLNVFRGDLDVNGHDPDVIDCNLDVSQHDPNVIDVSLDALPHELDVIKRDLNVIAR